MEQSEIEKIIEEISSRLETKMSGLEKKMSGLEKKVKTQISGLETKMSEQNRKLREEFKDELYTIKRQNEMNANHSSGSGGFLESFSQASAARARSREVNPYYLR